MKTHGWYLYFVQPIFSSFPPLETPISQAIQFQNVVQRPILWGFPKECVDEIENWFGTFIWGKFSTLAAAIDALLDKFLEYFQDSIFE